MPPNTASASLLPYTCAMPQSSRTMVTFCASCSHLAFSALVAGKANDGESSAMNRISRLIFVEKSLEIILLCEILQNPSDSFAEVFYRWDETEYQVSILRKVIEVTGMDDHSGALDQLNGEILIRLPCRHPENRIPTTFDF